MRLGIAAAVMATLGVACGGSSSPEADPSASPTTSPTATVATTVAATPTSAPTLAAGGTACKYVTTAQAAALAGSPVKAGVGRTLSTPPVTFDYCDYIFDPGNAPGVMVAVASLGSGAAALFAQFKASKASESDHQVVTGVGDEAFFAGQNLNVRKGDKGLILYVGRISSLPRGLGGLPDEKRLAELVLPQL
ncbi:MAG: hypothetical protein QOE13_3181 [Gaiellaceae bacterium]|nr:hypothetical protein [Gaiellaceae bacterium]